MTAHSVSARHRAVSHMKVTQRLRDQHDCLQNCRQTEEGAGHPDGDARFRHISAEVNKYLREGLRVMSV